MAARRRCCAEDKNSQHAPPRWTKHKLGYKERCGSLSKFSDQRIPGILINIHGTLRISSLSREETPAKDMLQLDVLTKNLLPSCFTTKSNYFATMKTSAALVLSALSVASAFAPAANKASTSAMDAAIPRETILSEPDTTEFGGIWDPLGLAEMGSDETIAWYRHSEIKHGRVAMAAFVGWWAVGSGVRFPGELAHGLEFSSIPSKGLEAWDAIPGWGKAQMLLFAGLVELHDELFHSIRGTHYMKGGTPGKVC